MKQGKNKLTMATLVENGESEKDFLKEEESVKHLNK